MSDLRKHHIRLGGVTAISLISLSWEPPRQAPTNRRETYIGGYFTESHPTRAAALYSTDTFHVGERRPQ